MALEVQIGADSSELNSELAAAEAKLKRLGDLKVKKTKLGLDTSDLDKQITSTKNKLTDLKESVKTTGSSFSAMTPKVANGGNALMQFSRIAQDAPYGIIGIGNNLTATAEAFSYLKNQTGSTGGALKALASSLMGSGGILLGISLVTTAFTLFAQSGLSISDVVDKITGNFNGLAQAVRKASEEGAKSIGEEVAMMKALVSAAQNDNLSKKERLIAVDKLKSQFPGYYGQLSNEKIMYGDMSGVIKEVTKALLAKAIAEKLASDSADIQLNVFKQNAKLINAKNKTAAEELKLEKDLSDAKKINGISESQLAIIRAKGINAINASKKAEEESRAEIIKGTKALQSRQDVINSLVATSLPLYDKKADAPSVPKAEKPKKSDFNFEKGFIPGGIVNPNLGLVTPDLGVDEAAIIANEKLKLALEMQRKTLENFNAELGSIVTNGTVNALAGIGEAIGTAMASGGNVIDAVGKTILSSMGAMLQELGKATIAYGVGLIAVKAAIKNPYLAVAAGVAMVALGSAMSKSVSKSASSNPVTSGGGSFSTGASVSSPTSSTSSSGGSGFTSGTVVFEISGQSLIGVLSNTLDKNKRLGGAISLG